MKSSYFLPTLAVGIVSGVGQVALAQNIEHSLGPIRQSQEADPGGFTLMIFCIGLLVTMVLCLFAGTMFYFLKGKKKK
ncbi:MAG: hypothetical protein AB7W16_14100 [Candidatus Obscuribacterales bacterium]